MPLFDIRRQSEGINRSPRSERRFCRSVPIPYRVGRTGPRQNLRRRGSISATAGVAGAWRLLKNTNEMIIIPIRANNPSATTPIRFMESGLGSNGGYFGALCGRGCNAAGWSGMALASRVRLGITGKTLGGTALTAWVGSAGLPLMVLF